MRVLFIHRHCGLGGVSTAVRIRHLGLKQFGIKADFLFIKDRKGGEIFSDLDINIYQSKSKDTISEVIFSNNYDFISSIDCPDIHDLLSNLPGRFKILCEVHTPYPDNRLYLKKGNLPSGIKGIVTPSEAFKKLIRKELKSFKDIRIYVLPNPVEDRFFNRIVRSDQSLPKKYIGWVGRFDYIKNYREVLAIAKKISSLRNDVEFIIVGRFVSGPDSQLLSEINSFKRINFNWLPFIEYQKMHNFYELLRNSDGCSLSTSRNECQPMIALESMASGCAVISTNNDAFKELLEDGRCGALYKLGSAKSAVNAINRVLDDRVFRTAIINNAYSKIKNEHTVKQVSLKWKELLESLA